MENTEREFWQKAMSLVSNAKDHQEILEIVFRQLKEVSEQEKEIERLKENNERLQRTRVNKVVSEQSQRIQQLEGEKKELVEALRHRVKRYEGFNHYTEERAFLQSLLSKFEEPNQG